MARFQRGARGSQTPRGGGGGGGGGYNRTPSSAPAKFNRGGGGSMNRMSNGGGQFSPRGGARGGFGGRGQMSRGGGGFRGGRGRGGNRGGGGRFNSGPRSNFQGRGGQRGGRMAQSPSMKTEDEEEDEDDKDTKEGEIDDEEMSDDNLSDETSGEEEESDEDDEEAESKSAKKQPTKAEPAKKKIGKQNVEDDEEDEDEEDDMDDEDLSDEMTDEEESDEEEDEEGDEPKSIKKSLPVSTKPEQKAKSAVQPPKPAVQESKPAAKTTKVESQAEPAKKKIGKHNVEDDEEDEDDEDDMDDEDMSDEDLSDEMTDEEESDEDEDEEADEPKSIKKSLPVSEQTAKSAVQPPKPAVQESKPAVQESKPAAKTTKVENQTKKRALSESSKEELESKRPKSFVKADKNLLTEEIERKKARDICTLFVKNLPKNTTEEEIKSLSSDIKVVRRKSEHCRFGWLLFANEQLCEKNFEKLKSATLNGSTLSFDFCGEKTKNKQLMAGKPNQLPAEINPLELYVGNLSGPTSVDEMKRHFSNAIKFTIPKSKIPSGKKYAFVTFGSAEEARTAFDKSKNLKINGTTVVVSFSRPRKSGPEKRKSRKSNFDKRNKSAKTKAPAAQKQET